MRMPRPFLAFILLLAFTAPSTGHAAPSEQRGTPGPEPIAKVEITPSNVEWAPTATKGYDRLTLTVSGPGSTVYRQDFEAGKAPVFDLFDKHGQRLQDGSYNWELVASPIVDMETREAMRAARLKDDESAVANLEKAGLPERMPLVQSGSFEIASGAFLTAEGPEPTADHAAQEKRVPASGVPLKSDVVSDDLIVQGSACIGLDCASTESFPFDTLRLKANNIRIGFDDTSTAAGFPANDWQLTANDSVSGGTSKFSIEDMTGAKIPFTVTAGAATNSIFVDSTGRVGFRTSTPALDLHVATGNTPAMRLEQNSSGGFTAQTWDIGANEANFFIREVTGGSRLPFRIRPGAPTSSIDINASGKVGIGTESPSQKVHIFENVDANSIAEIQNSSTGVNANAGWRAQSDTATVNFQAHSSTRTITRFGKTLGGWTEFLAVIGNGLAIGTNTAVPLVFGTNNTNRLEINGSTGAVTVSGNFSAASNASGQATARVQNLSSSGYSGTEYLDASGNVDLFFGLDNAASNTRFNSIQNHPIVILTESTERMRFTSDGKIGIGGVTNPTSPIQHANGATLSAGGAWTNASSRELKQDISELGSQEALTAFGKLNPIKFAYKADPGEKHVGFIAEDVPDLVASKDHKGLSALDVVALLTKIVQEQQKTIDALAARLDAMQEAVKK